ncbi:NUDIX domain-containing protein [Nocardioides jensenii]|uniref:NUDIX domain-containing protein n=1 Tax=Nocardioides jensenii TaxID=1843 RepID=UPI00083173EA|nr:NUDIX domain-containing protein [Nocardioides jensenii]
MHEFSSVLLVDARGWILMQERDEHPVIDPDCWGFPGGHLEGAEDPLAGALREFVEETGVALAVGDVVAWRDVHVHHEAYGTDDVMHLFVGATALTDADITCNEGRRIVFVDPHDVTSLPLTAATGLVLPDFLASPDHARLSTAAKELS